jgi:hypothetical protein
MLPGIIDGVCIECGGTQLLDSSKIVWINHHGEFSTGLPDYWLLIIQNQQNKWGLPYYGESNCPECGRRTIISQMKYPNGNSELSHNCGNCGVIKIRIMGGHV